MTTLEQIDEFSRFAKLLAEQQGEDFSLEAAFRQWQAIDLQEVAILRERLTSYDDGERCKSVDEFLAARRATRTKKNS